MVIGLGAAVALFMIYCMFSTSAPAPAPVVYTSGNAIEGLSKLAQSNKMLSDKVSALERDLKNHRQAADKEVAALHRAVKKLEQAKPSPAIVQYKAPEREVQPLNEETQVSQTQEPEMSDPLEEAEKDSVSVVDQGRLLSGKQTTGHSWTNPETKDTYMKMYNEYHKLRSGNNSCHGCRYLSSLYKQYKFNSVFDAGCGTGLLVRELLNAGKEAYGVEAASLPLEKFAPDLLSNNTVFIRPLHDTPFKDEYFDFILSTEVFEHVPLADVDRSVQELSRVAKKNAKAFVTIGMGSSRFDREDSRKKSDIAGFAMDFKFHETVKSRRWWLDTFCAFGWYEDFTSYKKTVELMEKAGYHQNIPPRGWFNLVKGPVGSASCKCTTFPGRKAEIWCGPQRKEKINIA